MKTNLKYSFKVLRKEIMQNWSFYMFDIVKFSMYGILITTILFLSKFVLYNLFQKDKNR
jgi:hypothetical protein